MIVHERGQRDEAEGWYCKGLTIELKNSATSPAFATQEGLGMLAEERGQAPAER